MREDYKDLLDKLYLGIARTYVAPSRASQLSEPPRATTLVRLEKADIRRSGFHGEMTATARNVSDSYFISKAEVRFRNIKFVYVPVPHAGLCVT